MYAQKNLPQTIFLNEYTAGGRNCWSAQHTVVNGVLRAVLEEDQSAIDLPPWFFVDRSSETALIIAQKQGLGPKHTRVKQYLPWLYWAYLGTSHGVR